MGSKLEIFFYRHGLTRSNVEGRFGGTYNPVLIPEGWEELRELKRKYEYPEVERVYSSPAIRAQETASVFFPDQEPVVLEGLWEYKFGKNENTPVKGYLGTELYAKWLRQDLDTSFDIVDGETMLEASLRIRGAITRIIKQCQVEEISKIAVVSHGEILNLLMRFCLVSDDEEAASFMLCPNGMGVHVEVDTYGWFEEQKFQFIKAIPEGAPRLAAEDSPFFIPDEE